MKKNIVLIIVVALIIGLGWYYNVNYGKEYLEGKKEIKALGNIIYKQALMDKKIEKYSNEDYTLKNAKVIENPYSIAPLTALIIFNTKNEESIEVYVNDKKVTTYEKSKKHLIAIYGLKDNYRNKITLKSKNNKATYYVKTKEFDGNKINVEKTSDKLDNKLFLLSPNFEDNAIYDKNGTLLWYLDGNYAGDIEYIKNGRFYISDPYQGTNGVKINYSSFLEMDYLGKIYKQYISDYGYHHEIEQLSNNRMLVLGYDDDSKYLESVIYIMNLKNGSIEKEFDMYDVLAKIDKSWADSFGDNFDFVCNSAKYNEKTGELLISVRGLSSIMSLDMNTQKINWIFGDPKTYSSKFKKYLLKVTDNSRYPSGQHSAFYTEDGLLGIHNNDFDMFNQSENFNDYLDNYTSVDLYKIDTKKKTIKTTWSYSDKKLFSKVAGEFKILSNNNKLIDYGWAMKENAYTDKNVSINDTNYLNGVIVQLDENDNILFKATTPDLVYRTYKVNLYEKTTKNFNVESYQKISKLKEDKQIKTKTIKNKLDKASSFDGKVEAYINRITLNKEFKKKDKVNIYLVSSNNKTYKYKYKKTSIKTSITKGKYAVYVEVNDKMYDTKKVINFD